MPGFNDQIKKIAAARSQAEQTEQSLYQAKIAAQKALQSTQFADIEKIIKASLMARNQAQQALMDAVKELFPAKKAYESLTENLASTLPILMLPVHIETRFADLPGGKRQLLLRIYPDDIHVHTHESVLTAEEIKAGEDYWRALVAANRLSDATASSDKKQAAWQHLRAYAGPQRCLWVAKATRPINWKANLSVADNAIQFPGHKETKNHSWTVAPHTQLLPDKFIVSIYGFEGGREKRFDFEGAAIPDTVYLGPDPFYADKAYEKVGDDIVPHVDVAWMHDFSKALENGLALRIDVDERFFNPAGAIAKISVTGLLFSADPDRSSRLVEQMIENHYYSRNGFSLVPQGTPTNNTEKDDAGYTRNEDVQPLGYYDGIPTVLPPDADAFHLAELLGIGMDILRDVPNAEIRESAEARRMNAALYPATLGYYFERHLSPLMTAAGAAKTRAFFLEHVSARGPLPAIRVGDQPYGMLLTSDQRSWQNADGDDNVFLNPLQKVLNALQLIWNKILADGKVSHVGQPSFDSAKVLIEVMGLQAGSVSYTQRLAANHDTLLAAFGPGNASYETAIEQKENMLKLWFASLGIGADIPPDSTLNPPVNSLYVYENIARLLDKNFVAAKGGAVLRDDYLHWLATIETLEELEAQDLGEGKKAPNQILFLLLRHALLLEVLDQSVNVLEKAGIKAKTVKANKGLLNLAPELEHKDLTQYEFLRGKPVRIDAQKFASVGDQSLGAYLLKKETSIPETEHIREFRESLLEMENWPVSKLERLLANHIDLCFYRLDAWQTGMFHRKIAKMRKSVSKGIYIGAYGWVNDLKPETRTEASASVPAQIRPKDNAPVFLQADNAGFVQAPSLNHATASGLLLSGYHNHKKNFGAAGPNQPQPFAVNLSSERVRRAKFIFEGVQNGQSLDALLGYQFERGLHDRSSEDLVNMNLNQYIYELREKYPVLRDNIPQQGSDKLEETISAYPVINGLKLLEDNDLIIENLIGNAVHRDAVLKEKNRLADTLDAANDLLMAETAYQVVQGNNDRTVSVLNALKNADVPPGLEVIKTPRSTLLGFTCRASVHFRTDMGGQAGNNWTAKTSPRSRMESGLNRWLGQCLGNPETIVCEAAYLENGLPQKVKTVTLNDLQLQALDFVMIAGGEYKNSTSELEGRIARAYRDKTATEPSGATISIRLADGASAPEARSFAQVIPLARALRTLITTAKPASARDYEGQRKSQTNQVAALHGYDISDMENRSTEALNDLKSKLFYIEGKQPNETDPEAPATFRILFENFFDDGKNPGHFDSIALSANGSDKVNQFLRDASQFGIGLAYPDDIGGINPGDLLARAASVWKQMREKIAAAQKLIADAGAQSDPVLKTELLRKAAKHTLGDDFPVLPRFRYTNGSDLMKTLAEQKQLLKHACTVDNTSEELALESWIQSAVHVRPELEKLERVRILVEAVGGKPIDIDAGQTPYRPKDSWLALEFPDVYEGNGQPFNIQDDTFALAFFGEAYQQTGDLQSAFIVDEWTETIPTDREVTGIAYHYNQPNAVPPQSLLIAVNPGNTGHWTWETLLGVLDDTLHRAKTRAVEPKHILEDPLLKHLLPMTIAEFDVQEANVSLDFAVANDAFLQDAASDLPLYAAYK